ncbi:hypothetical protein GF356_12405 [candidate division GN15 bacterium]|nr:hypothetical protein [candidate division GN15 bacterium]
MRRSLLLLLPLLLFSAAIHAQDCCIGMRGNVNGDAEEAVNISDLTFLVSFLFSSGTAPECPEEADVTADGTINIQDLTFLVAYAFQGGAAPPECPAVPEDSVIQDLTVGSQFEGIVTQYNSSGSVISIDTGITAVVADTLLDDWLWALVVDSVNGDTLVASNQPDGLWYFDSAFYNPPGTKYLALKYPATAGDSYPLLDFTVHVESTNELITVPAGEFECYHYRIAAIFDITVGEVWACPNIGIIKADEYTLDGFSVYLTSRMELLSYSLAKDR